MKNFSLAFFSCFLFTISALAQPTKNQLELRLNKSILQPGDSLLVSVSYQDTTGKAPAPPLSTLELLVENEQGQRTRLRWPVINGQASGALALPPSLPLGKYTLLAGLQARFFEVAGKTQDDGHGSSIQAMLLTKTGDWDVQDVPVAPDGTFLINNWLFEDNAIMAFSQTKAGNQPLDVRISTQLDSTAKPIAVAGRAFYVGTPPQGVRSALNKPLAASEAAFTDDGALLPAVVVRTTTKSPAQQFNEEYSTGLFRAGDERLISVLDNPASLSFPNILSYLQGRVAGLQIATGGWGDGAATSRGAPVSFFMDEVRVSAQQVASLPMADIAIVKAYPPPFFGAPGGGAGGGIAIYTRRGGEANYLPANKQVFRVRGYTPAAAVLDMNKLNL